MSRTRFAIVGCGRIAKNHIGAIVDNPDAELVAVCDLVPERAEAYATQHGVKAYSSYSAMLDNESVDVVCLLTPSGMHYHHAADIIARYQKHLVIEKPIVLSSAHLRLLEEASAAAGIKIFPIYQNRYNRAVQKVRRHLLNGDLGQLVLGTVRVRWCRGQAYYGRDPWRGTWAMDGGAMTNQGIHYLDLLLYLAGDVKSVHCQMATQLVEVEVEDTAVATLQFVNGALGVIEITTAARPKDYEASISLLSEGGTAILGGIACNELLEFSPKPESLAANSEQFPDAYGFGHWPFLADVISDLSGAREHPISMAEGARAIALLNALYTSAEECRAVSLDTHPVSKQLGRPDPQLEALYS